MGMKCCFLSFKALLIEKVSNAYNKSEGIKRRVADNFDIDVRQSKVC